MDAMNPNRGTVAQMEEITPRTLNGMVVLLLNILLILLGVGVFVWSMMVPSLLYAILSGLYAFLIGPVLFAGLKVLKPKEALVLTLFGNYYGTLKGPGFFFVHPFVTAVNSAGAETTSGSVSAESTATASAKGGELTVNIPGNKQKRISLKTMTLNNDRQKINDQLGNPIIIGIVVTWRVVNTALAVFNVDNYTEFLSIQCDSALRNIVSQYPYDSTDDGVQETLRSSSQVIADRLKDEIQSKVEIAGLEILEARITHLAYAPEIAAAMLQRQQASAVIDARQMIVDGAVGMVEMALNRLNEHDIVHLDEERKAAMVSNLLVVLCGNRDAQPIVNSGSLY